MRRALAEPAIGRPFEMTVALAGAALALILAIRIAALALNQTDLFFDEAQYWSWAEEPAFGYYSKPPLIALVIGATTAVCGDGAFCVRLASPLLHTVTAILVFLVGRRLYDERTGAWAALVFATLPGISFSSGIISTDVPLLAAWALALLGLVGLLQDTRSWAPALALGLGLGLGLNAKYAMLFFPVSLAVYLVATPAARRLLGDRRLWVALAIGAVLIAPNVAWNVEHKFATLAHTADNAKWGGSLIRPDKGLEFLAGQLGVFGPILFAALTLVCRRAWLEGLRPADRLLLCFTLPVLAVIIVQAFLSRAHANWAATAYVAASLLVTASLLRLGEMRWLKASTALHAGVMAVLIAGTTAAGSFALPLAGDPYRRTLGWAELGQRTRQVLETARAAGRPFAAVMADDRAVTATLLYYMREEATPVVAWREAGARPLDHYELTRPYQAARQTPVLLVATRADRERITRHFATATTVATVAVPAGLGPPREVHYISLQSFRRN